MVKLIGRLKEMSKHDPTNYSARTQSRAPAARRSHLTAIVKAKELCSKVASERHRSYEPLTRPLYLRERQDDIPELTAANGSVWRPHEMEVRLVNKRAGNLPRLALPLDSSSYLSLLNKEIFDSCLTGYLSSTLNNGCRLRDLAFDKVCGIASNRDYIVVLYEDYYRGLRIITQRVAIYTSAGIFVRKLLIQYESFSNIKLLDDTLVFDDGIRLSLTGEIMSRYNRVLTRDDRMLIGQTYTASYLYGDAEDRLSVPYPPLTPLMVRIGETAISPWLLEGNIIIIIWYNHVHVYDNGWTTWPKLVANVLQIVIDDRGNVLLLSTTGVLQIYTRAGQLVKSFSANVIEVTATNGVIYGMTEAGNLLSYY